MEGPSIGLPEVIDSLQGGGAAFDLFGNWVALAQRESGLRLLRIAEGGTLELLADVAVPADLRSVVFDETGEFVWAAAGEEGLFRVALSDDFQVEAVTQGGMAHALAPVGSLLATTDGDEVMLHANPFDSAQVLGRFAPLHAGARIQVEDDYAYVADRQDGLKIFWLAAIDRPLQVYGEAGQPVRDILVDEGQLYAVGQDGLRILDVNNPANPTETSRLQLTGEPQGVTVFGTRAFVALGDEGLAIIDMSNRAAPRLDKRIPLDGPARAVHFYAGVIYVAVGEAGLAVIEAEQPGQEQLVGTLPLGATVHDLERRGRTLYLAGGSSGLIAVSIVQALQPRVISTIAPAEGAAYTQIAISGKRAHLTDGSTLSVIDISNPAELGRLTSLRQDAQHVGYSGVYLVVLGQQAIHIYDARATAEPILLRSYEPVSGIDRMVYDDGRLVLVGSTDSASLVVLDGSNPAQPIELENISLGGAITALSLSSGGLWLADRSGVLQSFVFSAGGALIPRGRFEVLTEAGRLAGIGQRRVMLGAQAWHLVQLDAEGTVAVRASVPQAADFASVTGDGQQIVTAQHNGALALYQLGPDDEPELIAAIDVTLPIQGVAAIDEWVYAAVPTGILLLRASDLAQVAQIATPAAPLSLTEDPIRGQLLLNLQDGSILAVRPGDPSQGLRLINSLTTRRPQRLLPSDTEPGIWFGINESFVSRFRIEPAHLTFLGRTFLPYPAPFGAMSSGRLIGLMPPAFPDDEEAALAGRLTVYDVSDLQIGVPEQERIVLDALTLAGDGGSVVYLAHGEQGLSWLNFAGVRQPDYFSDLPVYDLLLRGDSLVALGDSVTIWDVSTRTAPVLRDELPLPGRGRGLSLSSDGQLLVSLDNGYQWARWDGSQFGESEYWTGLSPGEQTLVMGDRAYLALRGGGLQVVDISSPAAPQPLFNYGSTLGQFVQDLHPIGAGQFVVSWEGGLEVLEANTAAVGPTLSTLATEQFPGSDLRLSADGQHLLLNADGLPIRTGLLSDNQATFEAPINTLGDNLSADRLGETLVVADGSCGLRVIDLSDPDAVRELGYWRGDLVLDVAIIGEREGGSLDIMATSPSRLYSLRFDPNGPAVPPAQPRSPFPGDAALDINLDQVLGWGPRPDPCN
ncbi:MAG: hypothetical protein GYB68_13125, partial [Chloroflexi bacterium]|nr:hypothetical protein [Chloroflexota bacterium]